MFLNDMSFSLAKAVKAKQQISIDLLEFPILLSLISRSTYLFVGWVEQ